MVNLNLSAKFTLSNPVIGSRVLSSTRDNATLQIESLSGGDSQLWYVTETNNVSMFRLHCVQKGDYWALDVFNYNGHDSIDLHFQGVGEKNGQYWRFDEWDDGSLKISNDFTGPDMHLEVSDDEPMPKLAGGDNSGQHWTLSEIGSSPTSTSISTSTLPSSTSTPQVSTSGEPSATTSELASGTSTLPPATSAAANDGNHVSKKTVAGASVGGVIALALILWVAIYCWRRNRCWTKRNNTQQKIAQKTETPVYRTAQQPMREWNL